MALFHQAAENLLNGEAQTARLVLRELVNASVGFEALAADIRKPSKSLHRMLSMNGNPSMDNLAAIFGAIRRRLATAGELQVRQGDRSGGTSCS
ncbi:transcriptional regulator [Sphingomonas sp.]|uniref:transcriptional regulator n=1 Tax=Sphingomonas sp. TaxID=28214 RepID=UPI002FD99AEE